MVWILFKDASRYDIVSIYSGAKIIAVVVVAPVARLLRKDNA